MLSFVILNQSMIWMAGFVLVTIAAFVWGAGPERACAGTLVATFVLHRLYHLVFGPGAYFSTIDIGHGLLDVFETVLFLAIALRANRIYPLWLAGFELISLASHAVRELSANMLPLVYSIMYIAPSYFLIIVLAIGIAAHARRVRRYGPYRSWRSSGKTA